MSRQEMPQRQEKRRYSPTSGKCAETARRQRKAAAAAKKAARIRESYVALAAVSLSRAAVFAPVAALRCRCAISARLTIVGEQRRLTCLCGTFYLLALLPQEYSIASFFAKITA